MNTPNFACPAPQRGWFLFVSFVHTLPLLFSLPFPLRSIETPLAGRRFAVCYCYCQSNQNSRSFKKLFFKVTRIAHKKIWRLLHPRWIGDFRIGGLFWYSWRSFWLSTTPTSLPPSLFSGSSEYSTSRRFRCLEEWLGRKQDPQHTHVHRFNETHCGVNPNTANMCVYIYIYVEVVFVGIGSSSFSSSLRRQIWVRLKVSEQTFGYI